MKSKPIITIDKTGVHFPRYPKTDAWLERNQWRIASAGAFIAAALWITGVAL